MGTTDTVYSKTEISFHVIKVFGGRPLIFCELTYMENNYIQSN